MIKSLEPFTKNRNFEKYALATVILLKIIAYVYFVHAGWQAWSSVSDADFYDSVAKGYVNANNYWGNFLIFLNTNGFYSRSTLTHVIFLCNCMLIPWLFSQIHIKSNREISKNDRRILILLALYPTLNIFSLDIFREVPMVLLFLAFLNVVRLLMTSHSGELVNVKSFVLFFAALLVLYLLYNLRFYLSLALIIALLASCFIDFRNNLWKFVLLYFIVLQVADLMGVFEWMKLEYRYTYAGARSVYGIDFSSGLFLINFLKSFSYNIYGFYIYDRLSFAVFVIESVPALLASIYVFKNRQYASRFVGFLIFFFFIYSGIWALGVDSLGTAVRYRIFSYLAIFLAAILVGQKISESSD